MTEITVTIGGPPPDAEARRARYLRAKEVLDGASWLFDERISSLTAELLGTNTDDRDGREAIYQQIEATAQLKGHLQRIIQQKAAQEAINERRTRHEPPADHE